MHVVATSPFGIRISWSEPTVITGPTLYLIDVKSVRYVLPTLKDTVHDADYLFRGFDFVPWLLDLYKFISIGIYSVVTNCSKNICFSSMFVGHFLRVKAVHILKSGEIGFKIQ